MIRVGIVGGAGYTGGELLRLLLHHPWVEIVFVHSRSQAGKPVSSVHRDLLGETTLTFSDRCYTEVDLWFLCLGHGESKPFLEQWPAETLPKIIDLSQDFRWQDERFVYGLPEVFKEQIKKAHFVANPGCFATAFQLSLLPLAHKGWLKGTIHLTGITGSSGAGQALKDTSHYTWRNNNVSVYKPFKHQHLREIKATLKAVQNKEAPPLIFIPLRGSFTRGILVAATIENEQPFGAVIGAFQQFYAHAPFVWLSESQPDVKQVVNTNKALLYLEQEDGHLLVVSVIDNLLKGAAGQAVQNMNLMFGFEETLGLHLKPSAF